MNQPNLYDAWLTAGNTLQPVGDWLVDFWIQLSILAAALAFAVWAIRRWIRGGLDDYRTLNDRRAAWRLLCTDPPLRETEPGSDSDDLLTCLQILHATNSRKEKP